jgi:hypothetical protein
LFDFSTFLISPIFRFRVLDLAALLFPAIEIFTFWVLTTAQLNSRICCQRNKGKQRTKEKKLCEYWIVVLCYQFPFYKHNEQTLSLLCVIFRLS